MSRVACLNLPEFPLQLLLRLHPDWSGAPVAVVDCDRPHGRLLWVNERARRCRILPGMRYTSALSLSGDLRAGEVAAPEIERGRESTVRLLHRFTPAVELSEEDPGLFWLNAVGLEPLYDSLVTWARGLRSTLRHEERLEGTVVVGFTKFGTGAVARDDRRVIVFRTASDEERAARAVPLDRLSLPPAARDILHKLGVKTVGNFVDIPPDGIERRFGREMRQLHRLARGELRPPLDGRPPEPPVEDRICLDYAEQDASRLQELVVRLLTGLLGRLAARGQALAGLRLELGFECGGDRQTERLRPAAPTLDLARIVDLVSLRLASLQLPDGVSEVVLELEGRRATRRQLDLFAGTSPRDLDAANRALARIRAEFGPEAVVYARVREGHLPEALYCWEMLERLSSPSPRRGEASALVRRIYSPPLALPARPRHEPDGWMLRGLEQGPVVRVLGPYVISGGWWRRGLHREYHFAETRRGEILWVYYDRIRRRWFIQGRVE